jgi:hypothetical protein
MFDPIEAEERELEILLDKGMIFKVGKKTFHIKQPFLGTLDYLSEQFIKLDINKAQLIADSPQEVFEEQKRILRPNVVICARIVALAVLNSRWKIKFLTWFYTKYFLWRITPSTLAKLTNMVLKASNLPDFTNSIILMSINRTTAPAVIEKVEDLED